MNDGAKTPTSDSQVNTMVMRDFKFRAWSEKDGMEYPKTLYWFEEEGIETWEGNGHYQKYHLMQCTGVKDKNGKDIYEGDIVTGAPGRLDVVIFACGCFVLRDAIMHYEATYWGDEIEVKGNIFETPELLTA